MSGEKFVADTNVFINLLDKHPAIEPLLESEWHYNFVTQIELLGRPNISSKELKSLQRLLSTCTRIPYSESVTAMAISLRQKFKVRVPDALIAAAAIDNKLPLITFDKDFTRIGSLDVVLLEF